jgi:uncharacterized protein Smg (DUF494 family)
MADAPDTELSDDFLDAGWDEVDLLDALMVLDDALDYMDEQGYM